MVLKKEKEGEKGRKEAIGSGFLFFGRTTSDDHRREDSTIKEREENFPSL